MANPVSFNISKLESKVLIELSGELLSEFMMDDSHYRLPRELPFGSDERQHVTVILGGLTWKHERLIQAVLQRNGMRAECLPQPDRKAHVVGSEYCASGLCNPAYFTAGSLILRLRELEAQGLPREEIVRRYVYLTAGSCGPSRFETKGTQRGTPFADVFIRQCTPGSLPVNRA